jgi:hypothetical protein
MPESIHWKLVKPIENGDDVGADVEEVVSMLLLLLLLLLLYELQPKNSRLMSDQMMHTDCGLLALFPKGGVGRKGRVLVRQKR